MQQRVITLWHLSITHHYMFEKANDATLKSLDKNAANKASQTITGIMHPVLAMLDETNGWTLGRTPRTGAGELRVLMRLEWAIQSSWTNGVCLKLTRPICGTLCASSFLRLSPQG